jgi:NAD-dependent dihydropyrimidine dehydrogenase PreA subunit
MVKVWIDQDLCTGDGICVEICPSDTGRVRDELGASSRSVVVAKGRLESGHLASRGFE